MYLETVTNREKLVNVHRRGGDLGIKFTMRAVS